MSEHHPEWQTAEYALRRATRHLMSAYASIRHITDDPHMQGQANVYARLYADVCWEREFALKKLRDIRTPPIQEEGQDSDE